MAYLLGRREFWSLTFEVSPAVLVPRPDTELLVQRVLALVRAPAAEVADLGTGSGAIAIALAHERPEWAVTGTDCRASAGGGFAEWRATGRGRVRWIQGDWYGALARRSFDALSATRPTSPKRPGAEADGLRHEPRRADAGRRWPAGSPLLLMARRGT